MRLHMVFLSICIVIYGQQYVLARIDVYYLYIYDIYIYVPLVIHTWFAFAGSMGAVLHWNNSNQDALLGPPAASMHGLFDLP